jgi:hypothetical protein
LKNLQSIIAGSAATLYHRRAALLYIKGCFSKHKRLLFAPLVFSSRLCEKQLFTLEAQRETEGAKFDSIINLSF